MEKKMSDRLISANKLMDYINGSIKAMTDVGVAIDGEYLWGLINYAIENASTINSESVVRLRCKDCKFYAEDEKWCRRLNLIGAFDENDFCSHGELDVWSYVLLKNDGEREDDAKTN
jgi:hypothetical protein